MKKLTAALSAAAILLLPAVAMTTETQPAPSQEQGEGKVIAETTVAENAMVKAIDMKKRLVTLQLSDGKQQSFLVDRSVRKLGQVKVGDTVKVRYHEAVTVKMNKIKVPPGVKVESSINPDQKSVKPAGSATVRVTTTANIERIYDDGKRATLRMPDGSSLEVEVRDPANREKIKRGEIKAGDQIQITYHRAVAVSVEKSAKE